MKKLFLFFAVSFLISCSSSKSNIDTTPGESNIFSGKIIYEYQFKDRQTGKDITHQMGQRFGTEQHYFINAFNYKAYDGNGNFKHLYNSKTNTYYYIAPATIRLMATNAGNTVSEVISVEHFNETKNILDYLCKKVIIKTNHDKTIYWYSPEISISPEPFAKHKMGGWGRFLKESNGSLPLKFIVESDSYTWISTATDIKKMELKAENFTTSNEVDQKIR
ncbi:hypothetical protein [Fodinibius halophilus]|uniref:DUF3108 domain-containing protein n=1 Tax=Fodinibius halophilus TaxID=1736908 RepID=A0A6M1T907_9BACT|nr:hypothetical protein [Fodinibius halophilus]NGP88461.1 hypothetical protein [Fodinibius halophilus]